MTRSCSDLPFLPCCGRHWTRGWPTSRLHGCGGGNVPLFCPLWSLLSPSGGMAAAWPFLVPSRPASDPDCYRTPAPRSTFFHGDPSPARIPPQLQPRGNVRPTPPGSGHDLSSWASGEQCSEHSIRTSNGCGRLRGSWGLRPGPPPHNGPLKGRAGDSTLSCPGPRGLGTILF